MIFEAIGGSKWKRKFTSFNVVSGMNYPQHLFECRILGNNKQILCEMRHPRSFYENLRMPTLKLADKLPATRFAELTENVSDCEYSTTFAERS